MNTPDTCPSYGWILKHPQHGIEPRFVERLMSLCNKTNASIVVSSSWRNWLPRHNYDVYSIFREAGILAPVIGVTPDTNGTRGEQILVWLKENPIITNYLVLDDIDDFDVLDEDRVMITDEKVGLSWKDVDLSVLILSGKRHVFE